MSGRLLLLEDVDSTQAEARRQFLAGGNGPLWILARQQSAGVGRAGRTWASPPGNLHLSLLFAPQAPLKHWPQLSMLASLVVCKAIARLMVQAGLPGLREALALKWPNDLLLNGRKLGGILLETVEAPHVPAAPAADAPPPDAGAERPVAMRRALIIGWGINITHAPPPEEVRWPAISLAETGMQLHPLLLFETLRDTFWRWYQVWQSHGGRNVHQAWRRRAYGLGRRMSLHTGQGTLAGTFEDIREDGALLLRTDDGTLHALMAGEVSKVMPEGE